MSVARHRRMGLHLMRFFSDYRGRTIMTQTAARFSWSDYPKFYNRLPDDVDKSFARLLLRDGYMGTIRAGLDIISQFGACDLLGLFLLHRHFEAIPDTVFLERPFTPG